MSTLSREQVEALAQQFHETYERLAPSFSYTTRTESCKPWSEVPEQNKNLMIAVCGEILTSQRDLLRQREEESERLKQELLDRPFLDRVRIESGTEAVSALTAACKLRDAQLATTQQHLEVQQTATYQAVEREHEAKRQLAAKEAEIERLKERLENSKLCNLNLLTLHSHELDDLRAQLASMTKERGDLVEACTKHFQQACQERDALASMTAQVKELEANTHNASS